MSGELLALGPFTPVTYIINESINKRCVCVLEMRNPRGNANNNLPTSDKRVRCVGRGRELRAARCVRCVRVGSGCVKYILVYKGQYLYSMLSYQLRDSFEALQSAAAALQKYSPWPRPEHSPGPGLGDLLLV